MYNFYCSFCYNLILLCVMIINIGRQLGSGGREIGEKLAFSLDIAYYDKELIRLAAEKSGIRPELFEKADEQADKSFTGGLMGMRIPLWNGAYPYYAGLSNEGLFKIQSDVIRQLAEKHSCVFVGRCADYILRDRNDCLNLFISADRNDRIKRLSERHQIDMKEATVLLEKKESQRADFYNFYTNKTWGEAAGYHLCINSSVLGIDGTVGFLKEFVTRYSR